MKNVVFFITLFLFFQSCQSNFDIAKELYDQGEYREAINNYLIALESDSRKGIIYNDISTCYINLKIYDSALYFIDNALELDSLSNLSYHNRGRYHDEIGNFKLAIDDFSSAILLDTGYARTYYNRALVYQKIDSFNLAIHDFKKSVDGNYKLYDSQMQVANCYAELGNNLEAIENYNYVIMADSTNPRGFRNRATSKSEIGDYESALSDLDRAIKLSSNDPENYRYRGRIHKHHENYTESFNDFQQLLELEPENSENYFEFGLSEYRLEKYENAIQDFLKAEEMKSQGKYRYWIGNTLYTMSLFEESKTYYQSIPDYDPYYERCKIQIHKADSFILAINTYKM